ncbi:unnamed protein product [Trypanosoma congolense IL3000]|uniref:WGS project CAEQ00000000 data, annotated contig 756 n=1 Tax=Trypanosoma congolense (strain IL3000) TaxID=1068625 RepID=F9WIA6_TRYCI|nr:unnamed protein product [Trypanosoma congolense IL3000]
MMTEKHIHKMQSVSNFRGNVHVINVSYVQRARAYKEASAKKFICRWLHDCWQIRRAKRELESLRFAFKNSEKQRNEAAARIIQPVGRGAIARLRMRRILNSVLDDDDDANFTKVSVDFLDDAAINLESVGVSSVLQRVLQNRSLLPNFSVLASSSREVPSSSPLRTGSAVQLRAGSIGTDDEARNRPVSQPEVESTSAFNDGDEWGVLVSSQLEKRQKQMERARREKMRREFMNDPIRVKRELQKR